MQHLVSSLDLRRVSYQQQHVNNNIDLQYFYIALIFLKITLEFSLNVAVSVVIYIFTSISKSSTNYTTILNYKPLVKAQMSFGM